MQRRSRERLPRPLAAAGLRLLHVVAVPALLALAAFWAGADLRAGDRGHVPDRCPARIQYHAQ